MFEESYLEREISVYTLHNSIAILVPGILAGKSILKFCFPLAKNDIKILKVACWVVTLLGGGPARCIEKMSCIKGAQALGAQS